MSTATEPRSPKSSHETPTTTEILKQKPQTRKRKQNPLKKAWHVLTTGWVLEYPDSRDGPKDFFDRKPGRNGGCPAYLRGEERRDANWDGETLDLGTSRDGEEGWEATQRREEDSREEGCLRWFEEMRRIREEDGESRKL